MITVYVRKTDARIALDAPVTSGSIGMQVQFQFSDDWAGLTKTAIFETNNYKEIRQVPESGTVEIPEDVLAYPGYQFRIGVIGNNAAGTVVIPTVYADCSTIKLGANTKPAGTPPTPSQAEQLQAQIDALREQSGASVELDPTLTHSGKAADAKAVGDALAKVEAKIPESGGGNSVSVYKTEDIGELFAAPADYTAWCPGNLRYDKTLGKFVSLLFAAAAHISDTKSLYVTHIDPDSFVATQPVKCKYVDTDGVTDITPESYATCTFLILSDGSYLMINTAADGNWYKFTSTDGGVTWQKVSAVTGLSRGLWNMTELSNGRIIASVDNYRIGFYYSDNKGVAWTQVIPATSGGEYEAEACILEVEQGKLIAIARYSMSGKGYYESGDSEPAIFASSLDYGTTWTGWEISTIDNMNASSCTGIVHDGIVEIFATSRWYSNGGNVNTDNANTGKNGAMLHYMATAENALKNNFTRVGIIDYAKGAGGEYHSPCAALDDKNRMLIVHMDGGESVTCNNRYLRGELDGIGYAVTDDGGSTVKAYSAKTVEALMAAMKERVDYLQLAVSKLEGSGVNPPDGVFVPVHSYMVADNAEAEIYPWTEGSGVSEICVTQAATDESYREFRTASDGGYDFRSYRTKFRYERKNGDSEYYLQYYPGKTDGTFVAHIVKDGYITVLDHYNQSWRDYTYTTTYTIPNEVESVELHDGYAVVDGTKIELPRTTVEDYVTNYTSANTHGTHGTIFNNHAYTSSFENTADHVGVQVGGGNYGCMRGVKIFVKYE